MHQGRFITLAGILGFLGLAIGAFGTHGLSSLLEGNGRSGTFDTAVHYHQLHSLALLVTGLMMSKFSHRVLVWAGYLFLAGILIFSGSLYILAIFNISFVGAIAPIGGTALMLAWGCIAWMGYKASEDLEA